MELRPLTLLAGANSSGKSSMMQPFLLLKQTMEVSYDPGAILLDGPNARFSSADQIFSTAHGAKRAQEFGIRFAESEAKWIELSYKRTPGHPIEIKDLGLMQGGRKILLVPGMPEQDILTALPETKGSRHWIKKGEPELFLVRARFFLQPMLRFGSGESAFTIPSGAPNTSELLSFVRQLIHLPGLRGNPARNYPVSAVGETFPGTFEAYTASVIAKWESDNDRTRLKALGEDLIALGLTWKVSAKAINDTQVELLVGRLPKPAQGGAKDLVSITDVGFGVSQTLPVIVALHAAAPGQTVYLEQPEIHLHPRAQVAMARVLAKAIQRGVRLIVETHSSLLLLAIQTLVAKEDLLQPSDVKLHWFQRRADNGATVVTSADLDKTGAFGEWPEDFGHVSLDAENDYLTAAEARMNEEPGH